MTQIVDAIIQNAGQGASAIFLLLFLLLLWMLRQDTKEHKKEYRDTVHQMFDVVNKNTESNAKLSESISDLKDRIK
jgi:hypothetical protein